MAVTVAYAGARDYDSLKPLKFKVRKITFDSSYATAGEALTAADFQLTNLHSVIPHGPAVNTDLTASVPVFWNPVTSKLVAYRTGAVSAPAFTGTAPTGVTINVTDADGAAAAGVALYVHVDEVIEQGSVLAHLEFVSPTNADGTGTVSSGGATYYVQDDDNAATGGVALYFDEDATAGSRFMANTGRDCYVMLSNGDFLKVTHVADPAAVGVQVYFDEDAANAHQRALFVSPTNANGSDVAPGTFSLRERTPAGTVAALSAASLAEVASTTNLSTYSVFVTAIGD